jgi:hypothetical protein
VLLEDSEFQFPGEVDHQMHLRGISAAIAFFGLVPGLFAAEISVKGLQGPYEFLRYGMKWDEAKRTCQAFQAREPGPSLWKNIPAMDCAWIRDRISKTRSELAKSALADPSDVPLSYGLATGVLSLDGMSAPINFATSESCDAAFKNCHRPQLDQASLIASELRDMITKRLGRLAPSP